MLINFTLIIKADAAKYVHVNTVRSPQEIQTVIHTAFICELLRVVQTQAILFTKSMSERVGSDIERLGVKMTPSSIDYESN